MFACSQPVVHVNTMHCMHHSIGITQGTDKSSSETICLITLPLISHEYILPSDVRYRYITLAITLAAGTHRGRHPKAMPTDYIIIITLVHITTYRNLTRDILLTPAIIPSTHHAKTKQTRLLTYIRKHCTSLHHTWYTTSLMHSRTPVIQQLANRPTV